MATQGPYVLVSSETTAARPLFFKKTVEQIRADIKDVENKIKAIMVVADIADEMDAVSREEMIELVAKQKNLYLRYLALIRRAT